MTTVTCGDYTLEGRSISTIETWVQIPELNVCFDIGKGPRKVVGTDHILITHFHQDHALGITKYIATRNLLQAGPPNVYVPESIETKVHRLIDCWEDLEERRLQYNITGVGHQEEYPLRKDLIVRTFDTSHSVASKGFTVIEVREKLHEEYHHLSGPEIVERKEEGKEDLFYTLELPLVSFPGDTRPSVLDKHEHIQNSDVLITEATFLKKEDRSLADRRGHTHLLDIVERRDQLENKWIVLCHFSARYTRQQVFHEINKQVPEEMRNRIKVLA